MDGCVDEWVTRFNVIFNSISVISGRYAGDDKKATCNKTSLTFDNFLVLGGVRTQDPG